MFLLAALLAASASASEGDHLQLKEFAAVWRNGRTVRDRMLKEKIRSFCVEASNRLASDIAEGENIPYDLIDAGPGDGSNPLYEYRVLTEEFVQQRQGALAMLPAFMPAAEAVGTLDDLDEWLLARGVQHVPVSVRERVEVTLRVFLTEVLENDSASFEYDEARFQQVWSALEAITVNGNSEVLLAAPIHGVTLQSPEVRLDSGLMLVSPASPEAEGLPGDIFRSDGLPVVAVVVEAEDSSPEGLSQARSRIRKLVCALRLYGHESPALGGAARLQVEQGPWQVLGLEGSGTANGDLYIEAAQESELAEFCRLVANRWPRGGEIAWALRRHEFGCDRMHHLDGLSDHLLALRALLEPEGPASGRLNDRLAAICAEPSGRAQLAERTARAARLEAGVQTGLTKREPQSRELCHELEMNLRALLRDVICGHLDADLVTLADAIIAESAGLEPPQRRRRFGEPEPIAHPEQLDVDPFDVLDDEDQQAA